MSKSPSLSWLGCPYDLWRADVAQLAEAQALGACQCGFESRRRHKPHRVKLASLERVIALLGWLATASAGVLLLTQAVGWNGSTLLAALHALTPYLLAVTIPVAGVANWRKRHGLAVTSSVDGPDEPIRIFGVHPSTPISNFDGWIADLATFDKLGSTGNGLVSTSVQDFTVPGSDHRGFVVSVVPAR